MEQTLILVKPDGVQRGLIGEVIQRFERKGLQLVAAKLMFMTKEQAESHYAEHKEKPFFTGLVEFITSAPLFAMVWQGDQAIALSRTLMGATDSLKALPGTIRGDFAVHTGKNLIHGSDSQESAKKEIARFFMPQEIVHYSLSVQPWI